MNTELREHNFPAVTIFKLFYFSQYTVLVEQSTGIKHFKPIEDSIADA